MNLDSERLLLKRLDRIADALERTAKNGEDMVAIYRDMTELQKKQLAKADEMQRLADESFKRAAEALARPHPLDPETDDPLLREILEQQAEIEAEDLHNLNDDKSKSEDEKK